MRTIKVTDISTGKIGHLMNMTSEIDPKRTYLMSVNEGSINKRISVLGKNLEEFLAQSNV